ncbi:type II secretion system F family protein [Paenibacillus sp. DYY-L-2]|uniref:type II secretion system F family protein n=1 Tax=Paenibacillus sp. DYY-L-2 TaxID=3447013 RepID=UPI003F4F6F49
MELKQVLIGIVVVSLGCFLCLFSLGKLKGRREAEEGFSLHSHRPSGSRLLRSFFSNLLLRAYAVSVKIPLLQFYVRKVRMRLSVFRIYDEFQLRRHTMKIVIMIPGSLIAVIVIMAFMNPNVIFLLTLLIAAAVVQGLLLDSCVHRIEKKLLEQMLELFKAVRHSYQRHGMVSDAIEEACETVSEEIGLLAHRIHDALTDGKPDEALERFYETAPNRFLKAFAGISRLVMEFGDRKKERGSLYLRALTSLTGEIQLELIRRGKLDYLLKGLNAIALIPVFFTKPIEMWARSNFPLMDQFYLSKPGMIVKIGLFVVILICYILLQKLKDEEETNYRAGRDKIAWEARLARFTYVRKIAGWFTPRRGSASYDRLGQLLKDTNHHLQLELFQLRRVVLFTLCLTVTIGTLSILHWKSRNWILSEPPANYVFFGTMSKKDAEKAARYVELDKRVIGEAGKRQNKTIESVTSSIETAWNIGGTKPDERELSDSATRIMDKIKRWNNEYLKWWEVVLAIAVGSTAYYVPLWGLMFQRRLRLMDMRHEVYQFHTLITILRELERISVEEILEWLHSYAVIFKIPLQKCLLHFGHGGEEALLQMKEEAGLEEFRQLSDKLLLANEKISVADAFDELESEMSYHFERRRLDYEKSVDTKAELGRLIGFAPMYCLVFAYLVIPLIWMSFQQMGIYFDKIQQI